ncbi:hypothetical protein NFC81_05720 [Salinispirillum sp. LH 10-3-1]|uniref:Uncharacterized protein n=1 Tax=Salinispirillum sp. LH 10-3-1 TaxID=2952525 RepID=A0AB38YJ49_9GAMM
MTDRHWLLNINAVRAAQKCARLVELEFSTKMPLARTDFLEKIAECAASSDSQALKAAVKELTDIIHPDQDLPEDNQETLVHMGKTYPRWRDGKIFSGIYRGAPVYSEVPS